MEEGYVTKGISPEILNENLNDKISYDQFFNALGYTENDTIYLRTFSDKARSGSGENSEVAL